MSIQQVSCTSSTALSILALLWFCGVMLGASFTLLCMQMYNQMRKSKRHKDRMKERATHICCEQEQVAMFARLQQEQIALDPVMDERIDCSECWQQRHLGMRYLLPGLRLCGDHYARLVIERAAEGRVLAQQSHTALLTPHTSKLVLRKVCA